MLQLESVRNRLCLSAKDAINQSSINQTDVRELLVMVPSLAHSRRRRVQLQDRLGAKRVPHVPCAGNRCMTDIMGSKWPRKPMAGMRGRDIAPELAVRRSPAG